jgi:hypothetical protein
LCRSFPVCTTKPESGHSFLTGKAGDIDIAAGSVSLLDGGTISSDACFQGDGSNITIRPDAFFQKSTTISASGTLGLPGTISLANPNPQIVNSLAPLPASFAFTRLRPQCGLRFGDSTVSSFILTGQGGTAPQPQGWLPDTPADLPR